MCQKFRLRSVRLLSFAFCLHAGQSGLHHQTLREPGTAGSGAAAVAFAPGTARQEATPVVARKKLRRGRCRSWVQAGELAGTRIAKHPGQSHRRDPEYADPCQANTTSRWIASIQCIFEPQNPNTVTSSSRLRHYYALRPCNPLSCSPFLATARQGMPPSTVCQ